MTHFGQLRLCLIQGPMILFFVTGLIFPVSSSSAEMTEGEGQSQSASYCDEVTSAAITAQGWRIHPNPKGRLIEKIHVITLPVFLNGEHLSELTVPLNRAHVITKKTVIEKELRLRQGQIWSQSAALETERNLRSLGTLTSARVLPITSYKMNRAQGDESPLEVVIVTRDLWSLRLENGFSYNGGVLNELSLSLTERNLLGRRISLSGISALTPYNVVGGLVANHRRFGPDLSLNASLSGAWTRESGEREGEAFQLSLSRPLFNLDQTWSLGASIGALRQRARIGVGGIVQTDDDPSTAEIEETPIEWELQSWSASVGATRQWRGSYQRSLSLSLGVNQSSRSVFEGVSESQEQRWRELYLPPDRLQLGPSVSFSVYQRQYTALTDISTYGLREDLRLGPSLSTAHQFVLLGDRAYLPSLSLGYTLPLLHRGFVSASIGASARVEGQSQDQIVNRSTGASLSGALPLRLFERHFGFMVTRITLTQRWRDVSKAAATLGGDAGLRGYPNDIFRVIGGGVSRNHFEYRSPPLRWSFIHLGVVVFYEGGSVYRQLSDYDWKHSVGGGLRLLFPQLNRSVFRFDIAKPLSPYPNGSEAPPFVLSLGSSQGFWLMPWEG